MGKIAGLLAAVTLAGGLTIGATGTARADVVPADHDMVGDLDPYTSAPACLDDPGGSNAVGTPLELWHCTDTTARERLSGGTSLTRRQSLIPQTGIRLALVLILSACLGHDPNNSQLAGSRAMLAKCFIGPLWDLRSRNAYIGIRFPDELFHTGYCLALPDLSGGNAEPVILEPCGPGNLKAYWMLG